MNQMEREEAMELVGNLEEKGKLTLENLQASRLSHPLSAEQIDTLQAEELIVVSGDGRVRPTPAGRTLAQRVIRRHRLAERLIADVLTLKSDEASERSACDLEHALNDELTDSICTLLGHPTECPHGRPIPPGPCCSERRTRVESLIRTLDTLQPGEKGAVAYISTGDHARLDQLSSLGLFPGALVTVHQQQPALVILFEETTLALDREIAREIHVWKQ